MAIYANAADEVEMLHELLDNEDVKAFLRSYPEWERYLDSADEEASLACWAVIAIGQGERVLGESPDPLHPDRLPQQLAQLQSHYADIGGIAGYHHLFLRLLEDRDRNGDSEEGISYDTPPGIDLTQDSQQVRREVRYGIEALPQIAHLYPVGGAGDRLNLFDPAGKKALPAASLRFSGRSLLAGMIRDLQAQEFLHFKLFHEQVCTPVVLMTSEEKENDRRLRDLLRENDWFGRGKENFFLFKQPLVPVITEEGEWVVEDGGHLKRKPGGHGAVWRLAQESGAFDWVEKRGRKKLFIRQINNPIAGTDYGLLAFLGIGCSQEKAFGFASCFRLVGTAEGMNVLRRRKEEGKTFCTVTNIEYTDFKKKGIPDEPKKEGSLYSKFPANTNLLFADLGQVKEAVGRNSMPGVLINLKNKEKVVRDGEVKEAAAGRIETIMQNIADSIEDCFSESCQKMDSKGLRTYLTYNSRSKTISAAKKAHSGGGSIEETPEGAFYQSLKNGVDVLREHCFIESPLMNDPDSYLKSGPSILFQFHPALGPIWSVIGQKMRRGSIWEGSELHLEIAEVDIEGIDLQGSLLVRADEPLGERDSSGSLTYGNSGGKCFLRNLTVRNRGIDRGAENVYWKGDIKREECFEVIIHGSGEFVAEDLEATGSFKVEVADGERAQLVKREGQLFIERTPIAGPTWHWDYLFDNKERIVLEKRTFDR